jgi:hypothetical protein
MSSVQAFSKWYEVALDHLAKFRLLGCEFRAVQEFTNSGQLDWDSVEDELEGTLRVALYTACYGQLHYFSLKQVLEELALQIGVQDDEKVLILDIGCGPGTGTVALLDSLLAVTAGSSTPRSRGFDKSMYMVRFGSAALNDIESVDSRSFQFEVGKEGEPDPTDFILERCEPVGGSRVLVILSFLISQKDVKGDGTGDEEALALSASFETLLLETVRGLFSRGASRVDLVCQNIMGNQNSANDEMLRIQSDLKDEFELKGIQSSTTEGVTYYQSLNWNIVRKLASHVTAAEHVQRLIHEPLERFKSPVKWSCLSISRTADRPPF